MAKSLASSRECDPGMIEEEESLLRVAVEQFTSRMAERREIVLDTQEYFKKMTQVTATPTNTNTTVLVAKDRASI